MSISRPEANRLLKWAGRRSNPRFLVFSQALYHLSYQPESGGVGIEPTFPGFQPGALTNSSTLHAAEAKGIEPSPAVTPEVVSNHSQQANICLASICRIFLLKSFSWAVGLVLRRAISLSPVTKPTTAITNRTRYESGRTRRLVQVGFPFGILADQFDQFVRVHSEYGRSRTSKAQRAAGLQPAGPANVQRTHKRKPRESNPHRLLPRTCFRDKRSKPISA